MEYFNKITRHMPIRWERGGIITATDRYETYTIYPCEDGTYTIYHSTPDYTEIMSIS